MKSIPPLLAGLLCATLSTSLLANPPKNQSSATQQKWDRKEYKEEFQDGNCKVERKWERNGDYKEERKCEGRGGHNHGDRKEEFWDGNCKVERKWERNGDFKEERKCETPT